jgi:hypothetical protein
LHGRNYSQNNQNAKFALPRSLSTLRPVEAHTRIETECERMTARKVSRVLVWACVAVVVAVSTIVATGNTEGVIRRLPLLERVYTRWVPPTPPPMPAPEAEAAPSPAGTDTPPSPPAETAAPPPPPDAPAVAAASPAAPPASPPEEQAQAILGPEERKAFASLGKSVSGRYVWSSNRLGNHELFLIDLPSLQVHRLTNDPHVDYFSRFSPDGTRIAFMRSRRPWVSFREQDSWDVYIMNVDGSGVRRLAEQASHPTWTSDGSALVFQRGNAISKMDLASGAETVLYEGSSPPTDGRIGDPTLQTDGLLGLSVNTGRGRQHVGVLNLASNEYTPWSSRGACHAVWAPDGRTLIWISSQGQGGTRVMYGRQDMDEDVLIDLPGDYSHEYFPRLTPDGQWLVWGAAAEGHEHDRADYEMFVWKLGTPPEQALRLTYSPANDQWPDLHLMP